MKLELKHLAGYLPYELKIQTSSSNYKETYTLFSLDIFGFGFKEGELFLIRCKPILRPLSDLTKDENFELYIDLCDELGLVRCEHLLLALQDNLKYAFNLQDLNTIEEWMYKNHFDWKYNLIKNNLAIDKNTLK